MDEPDNSLLSARRDLIKRVRKTRTLWLETTPGSVQGVTRSDALEMAFRSLVEVHDFNESHPRSRIEIEDLADVEKRVPRKTAL